MAGAYRFPHDLFIRALVARKRFDVDDVKAQAAELLLPVPDDTHVLAIRRGIVFPAAKYSETPNDRVFVRWLREEGLYAGVLRTPEFEEALAFAHELPFRDGAGVVAKIHGVDDAYMMLAETPGFRMSLGGFRAFIHYFWNTQRMRGSDWARYLQDHAGDLPNVGMIRLMAEGERDLALAEAGHAEDVDLEAALKFMRNQTFRRYQQVVRRPPSIVTSRMEHGYIRDFLDVTERESQSGGGIEQIMSLFQSITERRDRFPVRTRDELDAEGPSSCDALPSDVL